MALCEYHTIDILARPRIMTPIERGEGTKNRRKWRRPSQRDTPKTPQISLASWCGKWVARAIGVYSHNRELVPGS